MEREEAVRKPACSYERGLGGSDTGDQNPLVTLVLFGILTYGHDVSGQLSL